MEHIKGCFQLEKTLCKSCNIDGKPGPHLFIGGMNTICMYCGKEDVDELYISNGCECPCHDKFYNDIFHGHTIKNEEL